MLVYRWENIEGLRRYASGIKRLQTEFPNVLPRIVNQIGRRARTRVVRNLTKQTGLERQVIVRAVKNVDTAKPGKLFYSLQSRGGFIRLKYFRARETRQGVSAQPFGQRRVFPGTFIMGGQFPYRHVKHWNLEGHVYRRIGRASQRRVTQVKSDVRIPDEMVRGETRDAFEREATVTMPPRVEAVIRKLLG
ncbi:hypothetical protein BG46_10920 [Brucella anthropi]|uniref:hypothetical protein n=1 Tax=Brucella anthropi TaxID=529 RepID=UPI00044D5994|nr:hypothetical protein [Brucella anthropi]EXL07411.1 hypothetical protein BG46_10920 [Brucella anthropi]RRY13348.1 hypothetical protein EGJ58_03325 [Brucella anthropi]